jgi:hypothetical protein
MDLPLAPGDRLTISFDTATADAPLGRMALHVQAEAEPGHGPDVNPAGPPA